MARQFRRAIGKTVALRFPSQPRSRALDTARMPIARPPSASWSVRMLELGRTLVERVVGGVVVRVEIYDGGGYAPSNAIVRVAGRVVAIREAGSGLKGYA
jgi:hypothetical protein